ncbi:bifunctional 5,10-methylenetetrahydrofolate dehydrogenase/5,10-methenyltetrahydrofolate cyclohydrolase [Candidatus Daviesbacteria bacterium]|nr:bifunctional 5,10-methylenetetrahydrofolate dehydrogenase/5,10-methenyltetrahydrofolate cyclohydrolase [Candidatus Daviesbacteria bacterium]
MMKVSGKEVADKILESLQKEIAEQSLSPKLAIILAGDNPASKIYVNRKIKAAQKVGVIADLYQFQGHELEKCKETLQTLDNDPSVHGIIIQYPVFETWDFASLASLVRPEKDVDGFLPDSKFRGATALGIWEMLGAFAKLEGFSSTEEFLEGKKIVLLGKGRTAGGPTRDLLTEKQIPFNLIDSKTENPEELIKNADVIISATGRKYIITGDKIKEGSFVIGVGVGKEDVDGEQKIYGDIEEESVSQKAKLYCPTIGGIGPLTIACLLRNVVESASRS